MLASAKNETLDTYLQYGWYRMGHLIFTTNSLEPRDDGKVYPVFWLRYKVDQVVLDSSNLKLINRNSRFRVTYRPFSITEELIALHKAYYNSLDFQTSDNLFDLLKDVENVVYDSQLVEVRDDGKLIAAGVFDKGNNSIAGIVNFYDPAYKKYSPGKFLMLMKLRYCQENGYPFYYPGYYSPEYPVFDYKLFVDKAATEVFVPGLYIWLTYFDFLKILKAKSKKTAERND